MKQNFVIEKVWAKYHPLTETEGTSSLTSASTTSDTSDTTIETTIPTTTFLTSTTTLTDTTTIEPTPKPVLEYKIIAIYIESGKKVLPIQDKDTKLSLNVCAKQTLKNKCCKTKALYHRSFTKPNHKAKFTRDHDLGTCARFLVGVRNVKNPLDSVEVSYKSVDEESEFEAKKIWICLTSDGQKHHMFECTGMPSLGPESMTKNIVSNCKLRRRKSCLMLD